MTKALHFYDASQTVDVKKQRYHDRPPLMVHTFNAVEQVKFVTRIYHPNVKTDTGEICSDILNENWGPTLNVTYVLNTIRQVCFIFSGEVRSRGDL